MKLLLVSLLLVCSYCSTLTLNSPPITDVLLEDKFQADYTFSIEKGFSFDDYIIVSALGSFDGSHPDIYISDQSNAIKDSKLSCKSYGRAICYFKLSLFNKEVTQIFVTISCNNMSCGYRLEAISQSSSSSLNISLNQAKYLVFEEKSGKTSNEKVILEKLLYLRFDEADFDFKLENFILFIELINPTSFYSTFNVFFNFYDSPPSRTSFQTWGYQWGAGSGRGGLVSHRKKEHFPEQGVVAMLIEAHEGAIIEVRTVGWGEVRKIQLFEFVHGFTYFDNPAAKYQLSLVDQQIPNFIKSNNLIISLVANANNPNLYIDTLPFDQITNMNNCKWVSDNPLDEKLVLSPLDINGNDYLSIFVHSSEQVSIFTLRAYYPRGKTPISFDYPEAGSLEPGELVSYSLSLYGAQTTVITLTLLPRSGMPGIIFKRCIVEKKDECSINDYKESDIYKPQFEREKLTLQFESNSSVCSLENADSLSVCFFLIGVVNADQSKEAKYTLKISNGSTHKLLKNDLMLHDALEFGKISYYRLNLDEEQFKNVYQVSFQLSNVEGQVSMFASFDNQRPTVMNKIKQSFYHSLHLYAEEFGSLNRVIYLGVQADSTFVSFDIQAKAIDEQNVSFYQLMENNQILITEDASKIQSINFKFTVQITQGVEIKIRVNLEPIIGNFKMMIGTNPESVNQFETTSNYIEFSSNQVQFDRFDQPFYGLIIPDLNSSVNTHQFKLSFTTDRVVHTYLALGIINQIKVISGGEYFFKIPIHSREALTIQKNVQCLNNQCDQNNVEVIVSYDQSNVKPNKGDLNAIELHNYAHKEITEQTFKLHCKQIDEFSVGNNCYLFITVLSKIEANLLLYADINSQEQLLFSDFPNFITFKPNDEKKLYFPFITSNSFNLFKTSSSRGDNLTICAKLINSSADKKNWPYPVGCEPGSYDFKFQTQGDESYYFQLKDGNEICDIQQNNCGLTIFLKDVSRKEWSFIDSFTITLQQNQIQLLSGQSFIDSLPAKGARLYTVNCQKIEGQKCVIKVTQYVDSSVELGIYSGSKFLTKSLIDQPQITIDSNFRSIYSKSIDKNNGDLFQLEVKSLNGSTEIGYSVILTIEKESENTIIPITNGNLIQVQLASNLDVKYFTYANKIPQGSFKVSLSQQTKGFTKITIALYSGETMQLPLTTKIIETFENVVTVIEEEQECNANNSQCKYIIQLQTTQQSGANFAFTISQVEQPSEIQLQENIVSFNELSENQTQLYKFTALKEAELQVFLKYGELFFDFKNSTHQILKPTLLSVPKLYIYHLDSLQSINNAYILKFAAHKSSKFSVSFLQRDTIPQIAFDQPLVDQQIKSQSTQQFTIQNLGDSLINIQIHFPCRTAKVNECKESITYLFTTDLKETIVTNEISQTFENYSNQYIYHIQINTKSTQKKIFLNLSNRLSININGLAIYVSADFQILDFDAPRFFYFDGVIQETQLFGIILPEKERKVLIEIQCLKGEVRAMGTYSRDSALKEVFEMVFQGGFRKILEVEVKSSHFYVSMKGREKDTQGYIKFVAFLPGTVLPWLAFKLPEFSRPIARGTLVGKDLNENARVDFFFDPLQCLHISQIENEITDKFEMSLVTYSLILTDEKQLAYSTDQFFTQQQGDFSQIEVHLPFYERSSTSEQYSTKKLLFFNFEDSPNCYFKCSTCAAKNISISFSNEAFNHYVNNGKVLSLIVRAQVIWKHKKTGVIFTETLYYSEEKFNKELLFSPFKENQENEGEVQSISQSTLILIIAGAGVGITGLSIAVIFFFKKYKQTANRLDFELTDVRNVANLSSPNSVMTSSQLKHLHLEEEGGGV